MILRPIGVLPCLFGVHLNELSCTFSLSDLVFSGHSDAIEASTLGSLAHGVAGYAVKHENHDENTSREELDMLPHMWQSGEDARGLIRSLRDDELGKAQKTRERKWLRTHDESEWLLNTKLMFRFGALFPELAVRS